MSNKEKTETTAEQEKRLRALGWMTAEEFMNKYVRALHYYLKENTHVGKGGIHHPEDIAMYLSSFNEAAYHLLVEFGASPVKKEK